MIDDIINNTQIKYNIMIQPIAYKPMDIESYTPQIEIYMQTVPSAKKEEEWKRQRESLERVRKDAENEYKRKLNEYKINLEREKRERESNKK